MSRRILFSAVVTNLALVTWVLGWGSLVGWPTYLLLQGTTLVAGGASPPGCSTSSTSTPLPLSQRGP